MTTADRYEIRFSIRSFNTRSCSVGAWSNAFHGSTKLGQFICSRNCFNDLAQAKLAYKYVWPISQNYSVPNIFTVIFLPWKHIRSYTILWTIMQSSLQDIKGSIQRDFSNLVFSCISSNRAMAWYLASFWIYMDSNSRIYSRFSTDPWRQIKSVGMRKLYNVYGWVRQMGGHRLKL